MTDIDRLIIGFVLFLAGYFVYLFLRKKDSDDDEGDEDYPYRLSEISGEDHFARPPNNLDEGLNMKYSEALLKYKAEKYEEAAEELSNCILEFRYSAFYYYRGICHFALKRYQEAINDWETAIILFPEYEYELTANINEAREKMDIL